MAQTLKIGRGFSLPLDYVTKTAAIIAKRRVGKTYTGAVFGEEMVAAGIPWYALDPTGAWWGLRSSADGQRAGLPVAVRGGTFTTYLGTLRRNGLILVEAEGIQAHPDLFVGAV